MVIVDTSALMAFFDAKDADHERVSVVLTESPRPLIVSALVVAELDYLILSRYGIAAELAALNELASSAWTISWLTGPEYAAAVEIVRNYRDQQIGLTDASEIILAARHQTTTIATLDRRHFNVLRLPDGKPVHIIPE
jgi:predicted nucleic acid-binding protein